MSKKVIALFFNICITVFQSGAFRLTNNYSDDIEFPLRRDWSGYGRPLHTISALFLRLTQKLLTHSIFCLCCRKQVKRGNLFGSVEKKKHQ